MSTMPYGDIRLDDPALNIPGSARMLIDEFLRDPQILAAPDGWYYLTGTTRMPEHTNAQTWNRGVRLWRSRDLYAWEDLGFVWEMDNGPQWLRRFAISGPRPQWVEPEEFRKSGIDPLAKNIRRATWAPEIFWLPRQKTYVIIASFNVNMGVPTDEWVGDTFGGTFILRSTSGKPEGPYEVTSERPLTDLVDTSLFVEDDGSVYAVIPGGRTALLSDDLSSMTLIRGSWQKEFPVRPDYIEGDTIIKHEGRYYYMQAINANRRTDGSYTYGNEKDLAERHVAYNMEMASATRLMGPYGARRTVLVGAGHGYPLKDFQGRWWLTVFSKPGTWRPQDTANWCRPYLVAMKWEGGHLVLDPTR